MENKYYCYSWKMYQYKHNVNNNNNKNNIIQAVRKSLLLQSYVLNYMYMYIIGFVQGWPISTFSPYMGIEEFFVMYISGCLFSSLSKIYIEQKLNVSSSKHGAVSHHWLIFDIKSNILSETFKTHLFFGLTKCFWFLIFTSCFFSWKSGAISAVFGYVALGFPNRKLLTISIFVRDELSVSVTAFEVKIMVYLTQLLINNVMQSIL